MKTGVKTQKPNCPWERGYMMLHFQVYKARFIIPTSGGLPTGLEGTWQVTHSAGEEVGSLEESHHGRTKDSSHIPRGLVGPGKGMWIVLSSEEGLRRSKQERVAICTLLEDLSVRGERAKVKRGRSLRRWLWEFRRERWRSRRERERMGWRCGGHQPG